MREKSEWNELTSKVKLLLYLSFPFCLDQNI